MHSAVTWVRKPAEAGETTFSNATERKNVPGATMGARRKFYGNTQRRLVGSSRDRSRGQLLVAAAHRLIELLAVQLAFPPRHDDRGDAVAADVGQRAAFAHELVDREHDGHSRH